MPKGFVIQARHMAGGLDVSSGERNLKPEQNVESMNMLYNPDGICVTDLGYKQPTNWTESETSSGIDGIFTTPNFPTLVWKAVNGKIKLANAEDTDFFTADTGISLTAGNDVFMIEYRAVLYHANGVENAAKIAIGRLDTAITPASITLELEDAQGFQFTNGADKVYIEDDEIDYTAVSTDDLTGATNIDANHAVGTYVTQGNSLTAPPSGSLKATTLAMFRDTMWIAGMPDEPNLLRFSKTVASIGTIANIEDFSDGNNYLIGEGGAITALLGTQDRLYVFTDDKVFYVGITVSSTGAEVFSPDRIFTTNYGCPNPFCVTNMEDVSVFFTGNRLIRIGYEPDTQQLLPDEEFDKPILPFLEVANADQASARLTYNPKTKKLRLTYNDSDGLLKTLIFDNQLKKYSGKDDEDPSHWLEYKGSTYFGDRNTDRVYKVGSDINANGIETIHVLKTGLLDANTRLTKRFIRGFVEGKIAQGTTISFTIFINDKAVGGVRTITDSIADISAPGESVGSIVVGSGTVGSGSTDTLLYPFRYPFLVSSIGEEIQLKFSSFADSALWGIENYEISGIIYDQIPYKHF